MNECCFLSPLVISRATARLVERYFLGLTLTSSICFGVDFIAFANSVLKDPWRNHSVERSKTFRVRPDAARPSKSNCSLLQ